MFRIPLHGSCSHQRAVRIACAGPWRAVCERKRNTAAYAEGVLVSIVDRCLCVCVCVFVCMPAHVCACRSSPTISLSSLSTSRCQSRPKMSSGSKVTGEIQSTLRI